MLDPKWTGTAFDRRDMHTLNIEQVVRVRADRPSPASVLTTPQRNFGKISMFGFASCLLATWESIALYIPSLTLCNQTSNSCIQDSQSLSVQRRHRWALLELCHRL